MDKALFSKDKFLQDDIRAVDAKYIAQQIAFSPLTFQAVRAMRELGLLKVIEEAGEEGASKSEISAKCKISEYGVSVLCEVALPMNVVKISNIEAKTKRGEGLLQLCNSVTSKAEEETRYTLGKVGWMLLNDDLTSANFNFTNDVCYKGAFDLTTAIKEGRPAGLKVFGSKWKTIYEALSHLPEREKESWFTFDHFYSDIAFPDALPIVYSKHCNKVVDIGGNTAKWAIASCRYNKEVKVVIVDLPGQIKVAKENIEKEGLSDRVTTRACNLLNEKTRLPKGAAIYWMSQFLDCFSLEQIRAIMKKIYFACGKKSTIYVLEPLWDKQQFIGNAFCLLATSLYFTCMANGCSKMYSYKELRAAIESAGFTLKEEYHNLGSNCYSLLAFSKKVEEK